MSRKIAIVLIIFGVGVLATMGSIKARQNLDAMNSLPTVSGIEHFQAIAMGDKPQVFLYVDSAKVAIFTGPAPEFKVVWDSKTVSNGPHMLMVRAYVGDDKIGEESHLVQVRN